jgi:hypothetical protein
MCQSQAEGGRRCAAHTRPPFVKALAVLRDPAQINQDRIKEFIDVATAHASTPTGFAEIIHEANQSTAGLAKLLLHTAKLGRAIIDSHNSGHSKPKAFPRVVTPIDAATVRPGSRTPGGWTLGRHLVEQARMKGFDMNDIIAAIDDPEEINDNRLHPGQKRHMRGSVCVVVDPEARSAITCFENWVATPPREDQTDAASQEYRAKWEAGLDRNGRERSA